MVCVADAHCIQRFIISLKFTLRVAYRKSTAFLTMSAARQASENTIYQVLKQTHFTCCRKIFYWKDKLLFWCVIYHSPKQCIQVHFYIFVYWTGWQAAARSTKQLKSQILSADNNWKSIYVWRQDLPDENSGKTITSGIKKKIWVRWGW